MSENNLIPWLIADRIAEKRPKGLFRGVRDPIHLVMRLAIFGLTAHTMIAFIVYFFGKNAISPERLDHIFWRAVLTAVLWLVTVFIEYLWVSLLRKIFPNSSICTANEALHW